MNKLKCNNADCSAEFNTSESLHPNATFTCRLHTAKTEEKRWEQSVSSDLMEPMFGPDPLTGAFVVRFDTRKAKIPKAS